MGQLSNGRPTESPTAKVSSHWHLVACPIANLTLMGTFGHAGTCPHMIHEQICLVTRRLGKSGTAGAQFIPPKDMTNNPGISGLFSATAAQLPALSLGNCLQPTNFQELSLFSQLGQLFQQNAALQLAASSQRTNSGAAESGEAPVAKPVPGYPEYAAKSKAKVSTTSVLPFSLLTRLHNGSSGPVGRGSWVPRSAASWTTAPILTRCLGCLSETCIQASGGRATPKTQNQ
jgi:hypothetical protein